MQVTPPQKRLRRKVSALADTVESLMVRLDRLVRLDDYHDPDAVPPHLKPRVYRVGFKIFGVQGFGCGIWSLQIGV